MITIGLFGACGKMGHTLAALLAQRTDCQVIAGVDRAQNSTAAFPIYTDAQQMLNAGVKPQVIIDFSSPAAIMAALPVFTKAGIPCVICTTGLSAQDMQAIHTYSAQVPLFYSANMSLGINLLALLAQKAQSVLQGFDIEIVEKHHRRKIDAPSGTALLLADAINQQAGEAYQYRYERASLRQPREDNEIGISSVRGGTIVGEHDVIFAGNDEVITLSHSAASRDVFANGAIAAALYMAGEVKTPGMYNMQTMLNLT